MLSKRKTALIIQFFSEDVDRNNILCH